MDLEQIERVMRVPLEDTSDVSLLRSRIDQQTHLIAILKQRSDDTLRKVSTTQLMYHIKMIACKTASEDYCKSVTMVTCL